MKVKIRNQVVEVKGKKVRDIFKELDLNPEEYVVVKNGEVVLLDEPVDENDEIELVPVVSGG